MIIQSRKPEVTTRGELSLAKIEEMALELLRFSNGTFKVSFEEGIQRVVGMLRTLELLEHLGDYQIGLTGHKTLTINVYSAPTQFAAGSFVGAFEIEFK